MATTRWHLWPMATDRRSLWSGEGGREGGLLAYLPFLGELWGEVGGDESWEEALDTVSSGCLRCLSLPSSDRDRIFFRDCGELVPVDIREKTSRISIRDAAIAPQGCWDAKLLCLGFFFFFLYLDIYVCACIQTASRWQQKPGAAAEGGSAFVCRYNRMWRRKQGNSGGWW